MATAGTAISELERQRDYTARMQESGFDFSLMVAGAFVRGIRDIGYRHTGTAIDELVDNSIQAEATQVHVVFGYGPTSERKPDRIAVIDNGHGMDPAMVRLSAIWGGTHRENDRSGFGRYGYGLPSAAVSVGRRFSVISRPRDGEWASMALDLDDIGAGQYTNSEGRIIVPEAKQASLPKWLSGYIAQSFGKAGLSHGTIILIENVDRLTWKTTSALERNLLEHFGVTYRNFLRQVELWVNDKQVEPVDPLFLTPGFRFYDVDDDRAEALEPLSLSVKDDNGVPHAIKLRFSYMPPTFQRLDKSKERGKENARFPVMKDHNGIVVLRNGRQIDIIGCPWTTFTNYDRNLGVEIDVPAALDEEIAITTSKQQVRFSERLWDVLAENGVKAAIEQLRGRFKRELAELKQQKDAGLDGKRASEQAMEDAEPFKTHPPGSDPEDRRMKSEEALVREVERRSRESGVPTEQLRPRLQAEIEGQPYRVTDERLPGAPFFRVEQVGGQRVLYLNSSHRFYVDVYASPESTPRLRAAIEVLLFVIGEAELDATPERQLFYQSERAYWSERLAVALDRLGLVDVVAEDEEEISMS